MSHGDSHDQSRHPAAWLYSLRHRWNDVLKDWGWRRLLVALVALYFASGFYFVYADQQAVVLLFGKVREKHVPPGLHWAWPSPLSRIEKAKDFETKRLTIGVEAPDQILGRGAGEAKAHFLTGDQNIINIRLVVQYAIKDPVQYLFKTKDITSVIGKTVESLLSSVVVRRKVDDLLTTEKIMVQSEVLREGQQLLDSYECGVSISSISIESMAPPGEVLEAFRDVASAREDRERIKREADSYANDVVPKARGEAARLLAEAAGYCERKINQAIGDADRFRSLAAEYFRARDVTATRLFLEAMEEVLPRLKKIVVEPGPGGIDLDLVERK